jgi:hypothetical protein
MWYPGQVVLLSSAVDGGGGWWRCAGFLCASYLWDKSGRSNSVLGILSVFKPYWVAVNCTHMWCWNILEYAVVLLVYVSGVSRWINVSLYYW